MDRALINRVYGDLAAELLNAFPERWKNHCSQCQLQCVADENGVMPHARIVEVDSAGKMNANQARPGM